MEVRKRHEKRNALALLHVPGEGTGLLGSILESEGIGCHEVALYRDEKIPELEDYDLMLVMGGPQQVWELDRHTWLAGEIEAIGRWVNELDNPYFGVCLGHQLLAAALGSSVVPASNHEIGFPGVSLNSAAEEETLFDNLPPTTRWLQWHTAEVAAVPPRFRVLASSRDCAVQAMGLGSRVVSVQFHPEGDAKLLSLWTTDEETVAEIKALDGHNGIPRLIAAAEEYLPEANRCAELLFRRWLELNGLLSKQPEKRDGR